MLPTDGRLRWSYSARQVFAFDRKIAQRYRLRLARYAVLAQDIDSWAGEAARAGRVLSLFDCGCGWGGLVHCLEAEPNFTNLAISASDRTDQVTHKRDIYREFFVGDLTDGYPEIPSNHYDVVVCEQVLEHLECLDVALATLARVVRPGGVLAIGVPIFFPPLHLARKYLVPRVARLIGHPETASHLQAFSLFSLRRLLRAYPELRIVKTRGFRIVSGGLLRPLENYAWWWRFNRRLGELLPALCIEVQVLLVKSPA
ncbi:MAG TPA: methyltransferase domain-containing protein [Stellaceae bacterium]|nr:methyltransferase domain-containing protein [Stellaceae bacterium]